MNLESINNKYVIATFKILLPIFIVIFTGISLFTIRYSREENKRQESDMKQTILSYQSNISEKISILTSSNTFVDFIRSGEISRKEQLLDIKILFSNLKDNSIKGMILYTEENIPIFTSGLITGDNVGLKLCYLNDFLNTNLGSCRFQLKIFIDVNNLAIWLSQTNPNIKLCENCYVALLEENGTFGSFKIANSTNIKIPVKLKFSNDINALLIFEALLALLLALVFIIMHRTFKSISNDYIYSPIKNIVEALNENSSIKTDQLKVNEIKFLANSINSFIHNSKNQETLRRKASLGELATQVAHDLRSPIEILKSTRSDLLSLTDNTRTSIQIGINRLEEITEILLGNHKKNSLIQLSNHEEFPEDLLSIIKSIITEKKIEYRNKRIQIIEEFDIPPKDFFSIINRVSLKNILSNMLNNSADSILDNHGTICLNLTSKDGWNIISIKDNGAGIPAHVLENIFSKGYTTKTKGNGLGLSSAFNEIKAVHGNIKVESKVNFGTTFYIYLPQFKRPEKEVIDLNKNIILIDDDKFIRLNWTLYFQNKGIIIKSYTNIDDFLNESQLIDKSSLIYIDSNLGNNVKGEIESEKIYLLGFINIYLSTGYDKNNIEKPYWIKRVCSKNPAEIMDLD